MSLVNHPLVAGLRPIAALNHLRGFILSIVFLSFLFSAEAQIIEYGLPTAGSDPYGMVQGSDSAYWFTEAGTSRIGRIDTNGVLQELFGTTSNTTPVSIVVGPDSNLWFTEATVDKMGRLSPGTNGALTNGFLSEFLIHPNATVSSQPSGITVGPDGNLWFLEYQWGQIAVMNTNGVLLHEYGAGIIQTNALLRNIAAGPDGALWFTEPTYGIIGHITTNGVITQIQLNFTNCQPLGIIAGPDGAMWFSEFNSNRIGRMDTNFNYSDLSLPTTNSYPYQEPYNLVVGGDGNIWFTEFRGGNIGRINPGPGGTFTNGFITEFPTPSQPSYPTCIASGPDKNIWFGEYNANAVGTFVQPTLTITLSTNSEYILAWPALASDFILQGNSNLLSTNWVDLTSPAPFVVSNLYIYTNTATNLQFFRLFEDIVP